MGCVNQIIYFWILIYFGYNYGFNIYLTSQSFFVQTTSCDFETLDLTGNFFLLISCLNFFLWSLLIVIIKNWFILLGFITVQLLIKNHLSMVQMILFVHLSIKWTFTLHFYFSGYASLPFHLLDQLFYFYSGLSRSRM